MEVHSDSSEDEGLEDPHYPAAAADERHDVRKFAAEMILELRSNCLTTREDVTRTIMCVEKIMQADRLNIHRELHVLLQRNNIHNYPSSVRLLNKLQEVGPFQGMRTKKGQIAAIKSYFNYVTPETKYLGQRVDQINVGRFIRQRPVHQSFQYVSLKELLKLVISQPYVKTFTENLRPGQREYLQYCCDGQKFQRNEFLMRHPETMILLLYYDEVDACNAQGSKTGIHMLGNFYLLLLNMPQHLNSTLAAIHLLALCYYEDILEDGFRPILQPFLDELAELESDEGYRTVINDEEVTLRAVLMGFSGDAKSSHHILGFLASGARCFCPQCMITRPEHHAGVQQGVPRNPADHAEHVQRVTANPAARTQTGVKEMSCLNDARFFNCTQNYIFDMDHDLAEGIIPMEIRLVLKRFVCAVPAVFTAQTLNRRIRAFNYGVQDMKNKPSANFYAASLATALTSHSMKQTMAQTYCLLRVLPFLLDNLVPEDDEHMQLINLLQQIVETSLGPRILPGILPHYRMLIRMHKELAQRLFSGLHLINKYHHLEHYADNIEEMGPPVITRTIRAEGNHRPLRRHIVTCGSYVDLPKTAAESAQVSQAKVWSPNTDYFKEIRISGAERKEVQELECAGILMNGGFQPHDNVYTVHSGSYLGLEYRENEFIVLTPGRRTESGLPVFAKISNVLSANDGKDLWLEIRRWTTEYLKESFNSFVVVPCENANVEVVDSKSLPLHSCISPWSDYSTNNVYLSLHHIVV